MADPIKLRITFNDAKIVAPFYGHLSRLKFCVVHWVHFITRFLETLQTDWYDSLKKKK